MSSTYRFEAYASCAVVPANGRAVSDLGKRLAGDAIAAFPTTTGTSTTTVTDSPPGPPC